MIAHTKIDDCCVGPKALFDQNFIPPKLLYREKETKSLYSLLNDALSDGFSLNILYQGIQGIGKKVIINKVIQDLYELNNEPSQIHKISINCSEKSIEEIMISILVEISSFQNLNFGYNTILNSNISDLWRIFKLLCKKYQGDLIFVFNNIEAIKPELFRKFLQFGKETNINLISTINNVLKPKTLDILTEFDLKKKLNYFSFKELFGILNQRVKLTFSHDIDRNLIKYITDLIFEQFVPVPGKGIDVLKELYPYLTHQTKIESKEIIGVVQNQFDSSHYIDEFNLFSYFSEADLLNIIFLDNLSNFFLRSNNYYISSDKLKDIYELSCESVDYEKNTEEFISIITTLTNIGILNVSKKRIPKFNSFSSNPMVDSKDFFITITPNQQKAIADSIFN
jgi:Cdc6-like AAA superfamily ATPase